MRKFFGTDGIRGRVGEYPITPEFIMKLGWAAGRVLAKNGNGPVLIGKDTRLSGYMFESALEAGLSAAGVDIRLLGPLPTPGIAYLTHNTRAQAGIVISASHNPYHDNGIKFFSSDGKKLPDDIELAIEAELDQAMYIDGPSRLGKARRINDAPRRYIEFCKSRFDSKLNLSGLHIVIDCAHGACYHITPKVISELGAKIDVIGAEPDGVNINDGYGATSTEKLTQAVLFRQADIGIALDGDGDRVILVDSQGEVVDGDEILYIIAKSKAESINGAVVGTLMSNQGLESAIKDLNLKFYRANVGDRYVMDVLSENNLKLGGESSGHIIDLNMATSGDGTISALQVLHVMTQTGKSLHDLKSGMIKYPQKLVNVKLKSEFDPNKLPEINAAVHEAEQILGDNGRVLLRPSGTEPVMRVMVEGADLVEVDSLIQMLVSRVENILQK